MPHCPHDEIARERSAVTSIYSDPAASVTDKPYQFFGRIKEHVLLKDRNNETYFCAAGHKKEHRCAVHFSGAHHLSRSHTTVETCEFKDSQLLFDPGGREFTWDEVIDSTPKPEREVGQ